MQQQLSEEHVQQLVEALLAQTEQADAAVSFALWAVAKMQRRVSPWHLEQLVAALVAKQQDADPQAVSNTLWQLCSGSCQSSICSNWRS